MKYALILVLMLLPVAGWAWEPQTDHRFFYLDKRAEQGDVVEIPTPKGFRLYEQVDCFNPSCKLPPDCLAMMTAAMKAMDKVVTVVGVGEMKDDLIVQYSVTGMQKVMQQWTDAQRCWRTP